jgi:hypothetical protein
MQRETYQHSQVYAVIWWLVPLTTLGGALLGYLSGDPDHPVGTAILLSMGALLMLVFGRLKVRLDDQSLRWHFGFLGWPRWKLPLSQIRQVAKCSVSGIGGSGIQRAGGHWVYSAGGSHGVQLWLKDGRQLRLGSDDHERLKAAIEHRLAAASGAA